MDIVVCVKRVPMTQTADLQIDASGKDVEKDALVYDINEWDNYAIEEAILLNEELGGTVTAVTVGKEDDEEVLRLCQAMGADKAIRIDPGGRVLDGFVISKILSKVIEDMPHDLVLTGVQSGDLNQGMVGSLLAEHLGLAHAAVVTDIDLNGDEVGIAVEMEGGAVEQSGIRLPALLSIQTGINDTRYVSITALKNAAKQPLDVVDLDVLGLSEDDLTPRTTVEEVYLVLGSDGAEMIEGDPLTVAERIMRIFSEKGVAKNG